MTWCCSTDRWTCPDCGRSFSRRWNNGRTQDQWLTTLRDLQVWHAERCPGPGARTR